MLGLQAESGHCDVLESRELSHATRDHRGSLVSQGLVLEILQLSEGLPHG